MEENNGIKIKTDIFYFILILSTIGALTYMEVLNRELQVMDSTAASLCKDNNIPLVVFNINVEGNMVKAVLGEDIGTYLGGAVND